MKFKLWLEDAAEIQSFLGNSVIRVPVYHGTNKKFTTFEKMPSKRFVLFSAFDVHAQGFFFSESKEEAAQFGRNLITAYVKVVNPLLDPRKEKHLGVDRLPKNKEAQIAFILRHMVKKDKVYGKGMDIGVSRYPVPERKANTEWKDRTWSDEQKKYAASHPWNFSNKGITADYTWIYAAIGSGGLQWDVLDQPDVVKSMIKLGYDGTFVNEDHTSELGRSIFVPDAKQILIVPTIKDEDFDDEY